MFGFVIDIVVSVLLIVTISFCWRLNGKIMEIKGSRKDLLDLVKTFDMAIVKTNKNISDLKEMSASSAHELQMHVENSREVIKDLAFMTDTAAKLVDRLEKAISEGKSSNNAHQHPNIHAMVSPAVNQNHPAREDALNEIKDLSESLTAKQGLIASRFAKTRKDLLSAIKGARG